MPSFHWEDIKMSFVSRFARLLPSFLLAASLTAAGFVTNLVSNANAQSADPAYGKRLADAAWYGRLGWSEGRCYEYVWKALVNVLGSGIEALPVPVTSAYQFGDWVDANPSTARSRLKLSRSSVGRLNAPEGSVIVWDPGQCGYHGVHGHIEVALGDGTACSDFCGPIATGCDSPRIYVPVK
jgi:hypothetical protein